MQSIVCKSPGELFEVAEKILHAHPEQKIFLFYGAMGSGKTTLIKEMCRALGVAEMVNSPSFSIVNEYKTVLGKTIYHFDFYRIKKISEAYDIGFEEYVFSNHYCLIEWPEKIEELLPPDFVYIKIEEQADKSRLIFY
jgi:tRNA threonylcarbamoyladenosine biosynthesis protein TsaE